MASSNDPVVKQVLALLQGGQAHAKLEDALADFPVESRGVVPQGLPYSAWQLLEHLRIAQRDILDFSAPPPGGYQHLKWPEEHWPKSPAPPAAASWEEAITALADDAKRFAALLTTPEVDLYTSFSWGDGQNLLREALLLADHNAYHTGELVVLRRLLGIWKT